MTDTFEAVYGDGWDGAVVNPLPPAVARERDRAGEPYTVVLVRGGVLHAVLNLAWADAYADLTRFDRVGRRISHHVLRGTPEGDLFLRRAATWDGPADVGEFEFPHVAARTKTTFRLSGERTDVIEPRGDLGGRREARTVQLPPLLSRPDFGDWQELLGLAGDAAAEIVDAAGQPLPVRAASRPSWRPPRPLRAAGLEDLFVPGGTVEYHGRSMLLSTCAAGPLRLPSGRVVADDPSSLDLDGGPFTVSVPPGSYPVTIGLATFADDPRHTRVTAARLEIADRPVVRWELALRPGQETVDLGFDQFFGFGVDAGMACFVGEDLRPAMADAWRTLGGLVEPRFRTLGDGDMVAWSSGWGDGAYPTWIGYDAGGLVVCFVADMQLFAPAEDDTDA